MIRRGEANESLHKGLQPKAVMQEEAAVQSVIQVLDSWPNPFAKSKSLVSLSSGIVACETVTSDLLSAYRIGSVVLTNFVTKRLCEGSVFGFHDTVSEIKWNTFTTTAHKTKWNESVLADRNVLARLLSVAQSMSFDLKQVFSFERGPARGHWPYLTAQWSKPANLTFAVLGRAVRGKTLGASPYSTAGNTRH